MQRLQYFIKRLLLVIPTFLGITFVCFAICQLVPGGPIEQAISQIKGRAAGEAGAAAGRTPGEALSPEHLQKLREFYHFDQPIYRRYYIWLVHEKCGLTTKSYERTDKTAWQEIAKCFRVSLIFGLTGFILSYLVCIPLGISKALRDGGPFDTTSSIIVFIGYAIPPFAFGMILKMLFSGTVEGLWDWFPISGFTSDQYDALSTWVGVRDITWHMFLPVLCYVIGDFALLTILMKNSLLEQIGRDYIRTVLAKGGSSRRAIWRHALRNAMIPLATGLGGILTIMFAGSVLIENVFEIPGMGVRSLQAIVNRDYPVFMAILAVTSFLGLVGNIIQDFCYVLIDPRINFEGE